MISEERKAGARVILALTMMIHATEEDLVVAPLTDRGERFMWKGVFAIRTKDNLAPTASAWFPPELIQVARLIRAHMLEFSHGTSFLIKNLFPNRKG